MKITDILLTFTLLSINIGMLWYVFKYEPQPPAKPKSLMMDTLCITPHGHPVLQYNDGTTTIYVVVSAGHGYPIAITK